jgi:hypothetical protein
MLLFRFEIGPSAVEYAADLGISKIDPPIRAERFAKVVSQKKTAVDFDAFGSTCIPLEIWSCFNGATVATGPAKGNAMDFVPENALASCKASTDETAAVAETIGRNLIPPGIR